MGALNIRTASAGVNRLGTPRMPIVNNGAAEAMSAHARAAAAAADAVGRVGRAQIEGMSRRSQIAADALIHLGGKVVDFAADMQRREDERVVADALAQKSAWRQGQVTGDLDNGVPGIFAQKIDDPRTWQEERGQDLDRINTEITKDMTSRQRELFDKRNRLDDIAWNGRIGAHRAKTEMQLEVGKAAELELNRLNEAAAAFSDPAARELPVNNYFDAVEGRLNAQMMPDALRAAERHKAAFALISAAETAMTADWNRQTAAMNPEEAREFWDGAIEKAKKGGFVLSDERIKSALGSDGLSETEEKLLLSHLEKARNEAVHGAEAREREARQAVGRDFTERELALRDVAQELWADRYDEMGHDETLRKADPKRAMAYIDAANEMRTAASKAKEKASADAIKGNEENLARSLATLDLLKMDGSLSQDDANDAQAAIWRKFRALSLGKHLSPSFMRSFETRLSDQLSDQEANAMRKFYQAFGFSTELGKGGEPTATARKDAKKDSEDYYAPLEEDGVKLESRKTRIKAADLLTYGDTLLRTLRALGPDMNREGVVEREITRLKTGWMKGELDKNRDATVRNVMDMQRETRTRWEAAQPDKRSEEDDGRREDGNPAK